MWQHMDRTKYEGDKMTQDNPMQDAMGAWKSMPEESKVVIINTDNTELVKDCAQLYKEMYQQEAVGLFTTATPMEFI